MTETPIYVLNLLLVIAVVISFLYGFEAIARSAEIFVVIVTALIVFAMVMSLKNINAENLLPIFEKGITPL